jgi:hypothetical protein
VTRSLQSQAGAIGGNERWAAVPPSERAAHTAPAHAASPASLGYWEQRVDPEGTVDPRERAVMADNARAAHMRRLALASGKARRARAAARGVSGHRPG